MLTTDDLEKALPTNFRAFANQQFADQINNISTDPVVAENVRENFISYVGILKDGRFKLEDYLNAITYVSYKHMGLSNLEAYTRAHPQRYAQLVAKGTSQKDISSYVAAYQKGKLVNMIMEQSLVPVWLLNQDIFQKAINVQADLMINANSEKVRSDAANSLMTHLAKPKEALVKVDITTQDSGMEELKDLLTRLATKQIESMEAGVPIRTITGQKLIEQAPVMGDTDGTD